MAKTAMQEHIVNLKEARAIIATAPIKNIDDVLMGIDDCINNAEYYLKKEKQQIIDAANDVLAQNNGLYTASPKNLGEEYFNENYNS